MALDTTATQGTVPFSPEQGHYRQAKVADSALPTNRLNGANAQRFRFAHVSVIPTAGANVDVQVYFWNEASKQFVPGNPTVVRAKIGAGKPYEFTFEVGGRIFFVGVESTSTFAAPGTDGVDIYVSGYHHESVAL